MIPIFKAKNEQHTTEVIGSLVYYSSESKYYIKSHKTNDFVWIDIDTLEITFNDGLTWYKDFVMLDQILLSNYAR